MTKEPDFLDQHFQPIVEEEPEFLDNYQLIEDDQGSHVFQTYAQAKKAAEGNDARIWFIREGEDEYYWVEDCGETLPDFDNISEDEASDWHEAMMEKHGSAPWAVESYIGQFVNCLGYFVSTKPVRPEHQHTIFKY
jgi:hypothetical protein